MSQAAEQIARQFANAAENRRIWSGVMMNVRTYGAVGDGETDDTEAIQSAITAAYEAGGGVVWIPAGSTYIVTMMYLYPGVTIWMYGATLKRPANQPNWTRTLTVDVELFTGSTADYAPIHIMGGIIDGNRANQGTYNNYEKEQAHLIFLTGNPLYAGRLVVNVRDMLLTECVGDGVSIYQNCDVQISNVRTWNCFRGGIVVTGGYTKVQANNVTAGGDVHDSGIDIEIDGAGYGDSMAVEVQMNNINCEGDFDIAPGPGSVVMLSQIKNHNGPFNISALNAEVYISDSKFVVGEKSDSTNRVFAPSNLTLDNCTFVVKESGTEAPREFAAIHYFPSTMTNGRMRLIDCRFVSESVESSDTLYAVYMQADLLANSNQVIIQGGSISSDFDYGLYMSQGGKVEVRDTNIDALTCFHLGAAGGGYLYDVNIDSVQIGSSVTKYMNIVTGDANCIITHNNVLIDETKNVITTDFGMSTVTYKGNRTILGTAAPTANTDCLKGDLYRLKSPTASAAYEWIAINADPGGAASWKTKSTLGA